RDVLAVVEPQQSGGRWLERRACGVRQRRHLQGQRFAGFCARLGLRRSTGEREDETARNNGNVMQHHGGLSLVVKSREARNRIDHRLLTDLNEAHIGTVKIKDDKYDAANEKSGK